MRSGKSRGPRRWKRERHQSKDLAAAIAFWAFFSIFPLLIGIVSLAGFFLQSTAVQARLIQVVTDMVPAGANLLRDNIEQVIQYRGAMSGLGIVGLLWTASKGFGAVTRAVNQALGTEPTHHFLLTKLRYFLMAASVSMLAITSLAITLAVEFVLEPPILERLELEHFEVSRLTSRSASLSLIFLTFLLVYKLAPYGKVRWTEVLPGALLAARLFELVKTAFVIYLDRVANFEAIYGSLSSIIVLLLWLYLSALTLVFGAQYSIVRSRERQASVESAGGG